MTPPTRGAITSEWRSVRCIGCLGSAAFDVVLDLAFEEGELLDGNVMVLIVLDNLADTFYFWLDVGRKEEEFFFGVGFHFFLFLLLTVNQVLENNVKRHQKGNELGGVGA